jgi:hypothetical protein
MERYPSSARLVMQGEPVSPQSTCPTGSTGVERHHYYEGLAWSEVVRLARDADGVNLMESFPARNPTPDLDPALVRTPVHAGGNLRIWYLESRVPDG